ncbi:cyclic GMP-AMP synthase-like receptor 1 isoform X1 [Drosophila takahashii]|uniref:cyclic GMP-AMP synthase-like receptor 1 isoform X1 n=1 Tax=Drosophila takahashii TaxID=29030 RepID=UPI001CF8E6C1|nr:uncharacterized protein LOC108055687 [Drosophila takahashii]
MSSTFEQHLEEIVSDLYGTSNHYDFAVVRDFIMNEIVMDNDLLNSTCQVETLHFGSRPLGIHCPGSDYDVMMVLEFPSYEDIIVRPDQHRPGMVHLDFKDASFNSFTEDTLLDNRWYLKRDEVQTWIKGILMNAHGRTVYGRYNDLYELRYKRRQTSHTITAESENCTFSIDFVPAIKIHFDGYDWQAVPKYAPGPKRSHGCTFMVSDIRSEIYHITNGGENIQDAIVLLKALCEAKGLPKIRNYHLVSTAINYILSDDFDDDSSLEYVFLDLLYNLADAFNDHDLPYAIYGDLDLLSNFTPEKVIEYADVLNSTYRTLKTYPGQYNLSYERCSWHFYGDDDDEE